MDIPGRTPMPTPTRGRSRKALTAGEAPIEGSLRNIGGRQGVGFTCWNLGVMQIGPKAAGYFGNLFPVFGAALGILLLGEPFRWFHAVGGIVTLRVHCETPQRSKRLTRGAISLSSHLLLMLYS